MVSFPPFSCVVRASQAPKISFPSLWNTSVLLHDSFKIFCRFFISLDGCYLLSEEYLQGKRSAYILEPCREIGQSFEKSLRESKLFKSLKILRMNNKTVLNSAFEWCEELHVSRSHLWDSGILAANRSVLNSPDAEQSSNSQRLFKISINKHGYFTWVGTLCSQNRAKHAIQIVRPVAGNNGHWECDFFTIWQGVCFDIQWRWVWTWNTIQMANIAGLHVTSRRPCCNLPGAPRGSSFFIPPDERRAPLKTPAWEASHVGDQEQNISLLWELNSSFM